MFDVMRRQLSARLMFITQPGSHNTLREQVDGFFAGGGTLLQLRMKGARSVDVERHGLRLVKRAKEFGASVVVNDFVEVSARVGAAGVHLGREDAPPAEARTLLGESRIVGATAHSFSEVEELRGEPIDYIGLGPLRYTHTKRNLAPILGFDGVERIMRQMQEMRIAIPVYVIGGVEAQDVRELLAMGVFGVAVSGSIALASDPQFATQKFLESIQKNAK